MNEVQIVSLVALTAMLIFVASGLRRHGASGARLAGMAAVWVVIFIVVALLATTLFSR
ncbi:hypothetical protein [Qipengyuania thermophila]|uniref:hypothetical protein n=1 Tax=Qipengyuania thermophila TaxID=2509361 RepID=UPI0013EBBD52|nr:hypothetical protein [Qipengyuania thermophila]